MVHDAQRTLVARPRAEAAEKGRAPAHQGRQTLMRRIFNKLRRKPEPIKPTVPANVR